MIKGKKITAICGLLTIVLFILCLQKHTTVDQLKQTQDWDSQIAKELIEAVVAYKGANNRLPDTAKWDRFVKGLSPAVQDFVSLNPENSRSLAIAALKQASGGNTRKRRKSTKEIQVSRTDASFYRGGDLAPFLALQLPARHHQSYSVILWVETRNCIYAFWSEKPEMNTWGNEYCKTSQGGFRGEKIHHLHSKSPLSDNFNALYIPYAEKLLYISGYSDPHNRHGHIGTQGALVTVHDAHRIFTNFYNLSTLLVLNHFNMQKHKTDNMLRYFDSQTHMTHHGANIYVYARYNMHRGVRKVQVGIMRVIDPQTPDTQWELRPPTSYQPVDIRSASGEEINTAYSWGAYVVGNVRTSRGVHPMIVGISVTAEGAKERSNANCHITGFVSTDFVSFKQVKIIHKARCIWSDKFPSMETESVKLLKRHHDVRVSDFPASGIVRNDTHFVMWIVEGMTDPTIVKKRTFPIVVSLSEFREVAEYV